MTALWVLLNGAQVQLAGANRQLRHARGAELMPTLADQHAPLSRSARTR